MDTVWAPPRSPFMVSVCLAPVPEAFASNRPHLRLSLKACSWLLESESEVPENLHPPTLRWVGLSQWLTGVGVWKPSSLATSQDKLWGIIYILKFPCGIRLKLPTIGLCLRLHPCFAFSLHYPPSPIHFPISPGSISLIDHLHTSSHFIFCFWITLLKTFGTGNCPRKWTLRMRFGIQSLAGQMAIRTLLLIIREVLLVPGMLYRCH